MGASANPPPWVKGDPVSAVRLNEFEDAAITAIHVDPATTGLVAKRSGRSVTISRAQKGIAVGRCTAIIQNGAVKDDPNWRYAYTSVLAYKAEAGFGKWQPLNDEIYNTFNRSEELNSAVLPEGIVSIDPIPAGTPVGCDMYALEDGSIELWFEMGSPSTCAGPPNGADGGSF